jgi:hypothetical protein
MTLQYDESLSNFAFDFHPRRYAKVAAAAASAAAVAARAGNNTTRSGGLVTPKPQPRGKPAAAAAPTYGADVHQESMAPVCVNVGPGTWCAAARHVTGCHLT